MAVELPCTIEGSPAGPFVGAHSTVRMVRTQRGWISGNGLNLLFGAAHTTFVW